MNTPWGATEELRSLRLRPGRGTLGPEAWQRQKRRQLFGAMVAVLAERDYSELTVSDLVRASRVGRTDFYRAFPGGKEDCLLQAVESLYQHSHEKTVKALAVDGDWEAQLRAGVGALIEVIVSQPEAARMGVIEVYMAGAKGGALVQRAVSHYEALLRTTLGRCERRAGLPANVIGALAGGVQMLIHGRLRCGGEGRLGEIADELVDWMLSYETPPVPLGKPRTRIEPFVRPEHEEPEERIVRAVADICAKDGVERLTAQEIARVARISLATLYKHHHGAEACFLASFEAVRGSALAAAFEGAEGARDWPAAMRGVNDGVLGYLASEPTLARLAMIEVLGAGPRALERRDEGLRPFAELLRPGYRLAPDTPALAAEASAYAVYALVARQLGRYGAASLPRLGPTATFLELAPFLGSRRAGEIANEKGALPPPPSATVETG